ncbi:glutamate receptor 2.7-like [Abrus precatorius]|uniref:Glutamate receptor n=1 Tax=Abrus precatorius TaxID=3816 RepID=A0A8B8MLP3_ABRPR|nr:glutamate receptor 2.7-like [Abrus precatorius]
MVHLFPSTLNSSMSPPFMLLLVLMLQLVWSEAIANANDYEIEGNHTKCPTFNSKIIVNIGAAIDLSSRVGKEQKTAMEIAIKDINSQSCYELLLNFYDNSQYRNPSRILASDLANSKQVQVIIGTKLDAATLFEEIHETSKDVSIISLTSTASLEITPIPLPHFIQMCNDVTLHLHCIASIVDHFNWRKVTAIYEHNNGFASYSEILTRLSYSLRLVNAEIDHHVAFPSMNSLSDPKAKIEQELTRLKNKSNRVFVFVQSSLEFATLLFEKAKQMGMMGKGSVWIIADDVATLLDSVDSYVIFNMQGVVGCKTTFMEMSHTFKRFKFMFRRKFGLEYPEEEYPQPSFFALRAYDAVWTIAHALKKSQGNFTLEELSKNILNNDHEGLSGKISFKERKLLESPTFKIVNVVGKSYKELAYWSPEFGFTENLVKHTGSGRVLLGSVNWPGGLETVPKGWVYNSTEGRPLKIGVPAIDPCPQYVNVSHDQKLNETKFTGFSINVFETVVKRLPYHLPYALVPFYGSYDQIVEQVNNKNLDAAVGDIQIVDHRYAFAEFSQPYIDSGIAMVVKVKPDKSNEIWMFMGAFTKEMWLLMAVLHLFIAFVIWSIEGEFNAELKSFGAILWFSVTILFFAHREPVKSNLARAVLAPWLFAILIVTQTFTASLSSMLTVSQLEPSVPDIQTLLRTNAIIGCNKNTFLVHYLVDQLKFQAENVRVFDSIYDFPRAFENKEIVAAFTIAPHAEVFLATYCKGYIKAGPTLKLGGLGFAFPKGSSLAIDISRATLKAIESGEVQKLEEKMLSTTNCGTTNSKIQNEQQLGPQPFFGLFGICGSIAIFALLATIIRFIERNAETFMNFISLPQRVIKLLLQKHLNKLIRSSPPILDAITAHNNEQGTVSNELPTVLSN